MDECMESLGEATGFSTLGVDYGYRQFEIYERDRNRTAFISHHGLYWFTEMAFGLKKAPWTIQRVMGVILAPGRWQATLSYLDDIVVF